MGPGIASLRADVTRGRLKVPGLTKLLRGKRLSVYGKPTWLARRVKTSSCPGGRRSPGQTRPLPSIQLATKCPQQVVVTDESAQANSLGSPIQRSSAPSKRVKRS